MKRRFKKSFWLTLFLSYMSLLVFSMIACVFLLRFSESRIEESTRQLSHASLNQMSDAVENVVVQLRNQMSTLRARDEYSSLLYATAPLSDYKLTRVADLQSELSRQVTYSSYVTGMYIWLEGPQVAATTVGFVRNKAGFEGILQERFGLSFDTVSQWADEAGGNAKIHVLGLGTFGDKAIAVIRYQTATLGTIEVLELRMSALADMLKSGDESDSAPVFWMKSNNDNSLIAPAASRELAKAMRSVDMVPGEITRASYEGKELALMCTEGEGDFTVCSAVQFSEYSEMQRDYATLTIVYLGISMAIGLSVSLFLSKRNYRPIERLNQIISQTSGREEGGEFAVLEAGINSLLKNSQNYERVQFKEEKRRREQELLSLIKGLLDKPEAEAACEAFDFRLSGERCALVGIALRNYANMFLDGQQNKGKEARDVALFSVTSVAGEILGDLGNAYVCREESKIWVAVSLGALKGSSEKTVNGSLRDCCSRTEAFLRERLGIEVTCCISSLMPAGKTLSLIHEAYREVAWSIEQVESYDLDTRVCDKKEVERLLRPEREEPAPDAATRKQQFYSAVVAGDFQEADKLYLALRFQDIGFTDDSFSSVITQTLVLVGYLLSYLPEESLKKHSEEIEKYIVSIRNEKYDEHLIDTMHRWMVFFHDIYREGAGGETEEKGDGAILASSYINDHYTDSDISVAVVAEKLSISPSYLSRIFRKKYNLGVLDYIHRRRIDTAKVLLRESSITLEAVAEQLGYANTLALIRAFRRLENCTPTEYRKSLKRESRD